MIFLQGIALELFFPVWIAVMSYSYGTFPILCLTKLGMIWSLQLCQEFSAIYWISAAWSSYVCWNKWLAVRVNKDRSAVEHISLLAHIAYYILGKEVMFLIMLVYLSICLFVCLQHYSENYERIAMKFYEVVQGDRRNKWLNFGGDLDHHADSPNWESR